MKKIIIVVLLTLVSWNMASAEGGRSSLNERFYQAKLRELVYRLRITEAQQKKFEPIYRSYCEEMTELWAERKNPIPPSTSTRAAAIEKRRMELQQRAQGIRMKYIDKFAAVLNAQQVERFFEVESDIQKKLKERQQQARGQ